MRCRLSPTPVVPSCELFPSQSLIRICVSSNSAKKNKAEGNGVAHPDTSTGFVVHRIGAANERRRRSQLRLVWAIRWRSCCLRARTHGRYAIRSRSHPIQSSVWKPLWRASDGLQLRASIATVAGCRGRCFVSEFSGGRSNLQPDDGTGHECHGSDQLHCHATRARRLHLQSLADLRDRRIGMVAARFTKSPGFGTDADTTRSTRAGWTAGVGAELAIAANWTARLNMCTTASAA